jgi:hypothetical protein
MVAYQNLITKSMYDKQLDSGRGTLLHLCDDVIQQEVCKPHYIPNWFNWLCASDVSLNTFLQVKEVIISYYILMEQGKATVQVSIYLLVLCSALRQPCAIELSKSCLLVVVFVLFSHVINLQALKHIIILFVYVPVVVQANFIILVGLIQNF